MQEWILFLGAQLLWLYFGSLYWTLTDAQFPDLMQVFSSNFKSDFGSYVKALRSSLIFSHMAFTTIFCCTFCPTISYWNQVLFILKTFLCHLLLLALEMRMRKPKNSIQESIHFGVGLLLTLILSFLLRCLFFWSASFKDIIEKGKGKC